MTQPTENPFFEAGADAILLDDLTLTGRQSVLERLGPAAFRSKGFSFIGFLETLYEYISEQTNTPAATASTEPDEATQAVIEAVTPKENDSVSVAATLDSSNPQG